MMAKTPPTEKSPRAGKPARAAQNDEFTKWRVLYDFVDSFESVEELELLRNDDFEIEIERFADAAGEIKRALLRYLEHEVNTLDQAFEIKRPAGYRRPKARERFEKRRGIQRDGRILWSAGARVDNDFYKVLGRIYGINSSKAAAWYKPLKSLPARPEPGRVTLPARFEQFINYLNWIDGYFLRLIVEGKNTSE